MLFIVPRSSHAPHPTPKFVDVNKLIKARPLDNMEFMQWFKCYFDQMGKHRSLDAYDPIARRQGTKTGDYKAQGMSLKGGAPATSSAVPSRGMQQLTGVRRPGAGAAAGGPRGPARPTATAKAAAPAAKAPPAEQARRPSANKLSCTTSEVAAQVAALEKQLEAVKLEKEETATQLDNAERERDFYFDKLRDIEILCQLPELKHVEILRSIEKILYATDPAEAKDAIVHVQMKSGGGGAGALAEGH